MCTVIYLFILIWYSKCTSTIGDSICKEKSIYMSIYCLLYNPLEWMYHYTCTWLKYVVNQIKTVYAYIILFYIKRFQILLIVYIFLVGLNFGKLRLNLVWIFFITFFLGGYLFSLDFTICIHFLCSKLINI